MLRLLPFSDMAFWNEWGHFWQKGMWNRLFTCTMHAEYCPVASIVSGTATIEYCVSGSRQGPTESQITTSTVSIEIRRATCTDICMCHNIFNAIEMGFAMSCYQMVQTTGTMESKHRTSWAYVRSFNRCFSTNGSVNGWHGIRSVSRTFQLECLRTKLLVGTKKLIIYRETGI